MSNQSSHHHSHENSDQFNDGSRTRLIHHSWIFWVGVVLMFAAIMAYVLSLDLSTRPVVRPAQPTPQTNAVR